MTARETSSNLQVLYGPPDSWRHAAIDTLVSWLIALAVGAVLMYGVGLSWQTSAALMGGTIACFSIAKYRIYKRQHAGRVGATEDTP
jgi:hypothetical protein